LNEGGNKTDADLEQLKKERDAPAPVPQKEESPEADDTSSDENEGYSESYLNQLYEMYKENPAQLSQY